MKTLLSNRHGRRMASSGNSIHCKTVFVFMALVLGFGMMSKLSAADRESEKQAIDRLLDKTGIKPIWYRDKLDIIIEEGAIVQSEQLERLGQVGKIRAVFIERLLGIPAESYSFIRLANIDRLVIYSHAHETHKMIEHITASPSLKELDLGICAVTPQDLKTLAQNKKLLSISVSLPVVTQKHFAALGTGFENLRHARLQSREPSTLAEDDLAVIQHLKLRTLTLQGFSYDAGTKTAIRERMHPCIVIFEK